MLQNNGNKKIADRTDEKTLRITPRREAAAAQSKPSENGQGGEKKAAPTTKKKTVNVFNAPTILAFSVFCLLLAVENMSAASYVNSGNPYLSTMVLQLCIFVVPCAFYCTLRRVRVSSSCRIRLPGVSGWLLVLCAVPTLVFAVMAAKYIGCYFLGARLGSVIPATSSGNNLYMILSYALVPAIAEEICFRGILLSEYEKHYGRFAAVLVTSLLFAMIHFNSRDFIAYIVSGIIISMTVLATNSVVSAMFLHFFSNLVAIYTDNFIVKISSDTSAGRFALIIVSVISIAFVMLWLSRLEKNYEALSEKESGGTSGMADNEKILRLSHEKQRSGAMRFYHPEIGIVASLVRIVVSPAFLCVVIAFLVKIATVG